VATNVEAIALMLNRATDAAHICLIFLDDRDSLALLGQQIARRKARWSRANDRHIDFDVTVWA